MTDSMQAAQPVVQATMNYLAPMTGTPFVDVHNRGSDRLELEPHAMDFTDVRPLCDALSFDREGFRLVNHTTTLRRADFRDQTVVENVYLQEMAALVAEHTGADRVVSALGPIVRMNDESGEAVRPASIAHSDYTEYTLRTLAGFQCDLSAPEFRDYARIEAYQTWRAISPPPQDNTLALCDARTVTTADRVLSHFEILEPREATLEFYMYRYNPAHRWCWFSNLQYDEVILFRGFQGDADECRNVLHGAFDLPASPHANIRESIETRTYAFFRT